MLGKIFFISFERFFLPSRVFLISRLQPNKLIVFYLSEELPRNRAFSPFFQVSFTSQELAVLMDCRKEWKTPFLPLIFRRPKLEWEIEFTVLIPAQKEPKALSLFEQKKSAPRGSKAQLPTLPSGTPCPNFKGVD